MYKKILVPIDGSVASQAGLAEAIKLAKNQGAQLRFFHMVSDQVLDCGLETGSFGGEIIAAAREDGRTMLSDADAMARREGLEPETVMMESLTETAATSIVAEAQAWAADLIVMGTHGRKGVTRLVLGSNSERVARYASVPVLLVHDIAPPVENIVDKGAAGQAVADVVYA
jgi:nucleotide-binding universal stress UspA family protein